MFLNLAKKIFGTSNERAVKRLLPDLEAINGLENTISALSDTQLQEKTVEFRERLSKGETLDDIMHEAFAVVREASKRVFNKRHYDVQMLGGMVLHQGKIAEMRTGEGKTLMATLPVYLNALPAKGVHVVTVNDYLAARDSEWMGKLYNFLGLTVGCIVHGLTDAERKAAYACDITYATNNELGFDFLRDNMKYSAEQIVQREFHFGLIDEVDSILIDEARTPLIISGPSDDSSALYIAVDRLIPQLTEADYDLDEKNRTIALTEDGTEKVEQFLMDAHLLEDGNLYDMQNINLVHHVNQALRAYTLFQKDKDYIIKDDKVVIIDEFTGRAMEGRRYSEGLHQALEAKEKVTIQRENQTLASVTFQNYFRQYPKLCGMTGTALTEAGEFMEIYNLAVVDIPTNVPVARIDHDDQIYKNLEEKNLAVLNLIKQCLDRKQPCLVGTVSIEKSETLSELLKKHKIPHNVLNARYHEQEAHIVAQAGRPSAITIATNMAGRGTDIQLGGNLEMRIEQEIPHDLSPEERTKRIAAIEAEIERDREIVRAAGGLYVIGTERHESRRIDNQLRGRAGRQGDQGESIFFISLQDDLMRLFNPEALQMVLANRSIGLKENEALTHPWLSKALERAQTKVESQNFEIRKNLLKFDDVMNDQRKVIYAQRRDIMARDTVQEIIDDMRHEVIEDLVARAIPRNSYAEQWDIELLAEESKSILNLDLPLSSWLQEDGIDATILQERIIAESDTLLAHKAVEAGVDSFRRTEKLLVMHNLDQLWKSHLYNLDHLRQGINLRAFGQRDPLNEYKTEAFAMFEGLLFQISENVTRMISHLDQAMAQQAATQPRPLNPQEAQETRQDPAYVAEEESAPRRTSSAALPYAGFDINDPKTWSKMPRNASCPCGSGLKFKHCHGKIA